MFGGQDSETVYSDVWSIEFTLPLDKYAIYCVYTLHVTCLISDPVFALRLCPVVPTRPLCQSPPPGGPYELPHPLPCSRETLRNSGPLIFRESTKCSTHLLKTFTNWTSKCIQLLTLSLLILELFTTIVDSFSMLNSMYTKSRRIA